MSSWLVVSPPAFGPFDGVANFSAELASAINGIEPARLIVADSWRALVRSHAEFAEPAEVRGLFLQYSPPSFVKADLPQLLSAMSRLRARGIPIVTTIHEYWPPPSSSPKRAVYRWLCRRTLGAVVSRSSRVVSTTPFSAGELSAAGFGGERGITVLPVPTNIPVVAAPRAGGSLPIIAMFGQPHVLDRQVVLGLAKWLATQTPRPRWVWIARSNAEMQQWWRDIGAPDVVEFHGAKPSAQVSALLAESGIGLAVYDDGASTRRSSLAALLAHGLPIVGLDGRYTDDLLRQSGAFLLSPLGDAPSFIANLQRALGDAALRTKMAAAASRLYASELSWPHIAAQYLEAASR